jgi:hypothetical protein
MNRQTDDELEPVMSKTGLGVSGKNFARKYQPNPLRKDLNTKKRPARSSSRRARIRKGPMLKKGPR